MRICRFETPSHPEPRYGIVDGEIVVILDAPPFDGVKPGKGRIALDEVTLLPPTQPTKIVCVGLNDKKHADEMGKTLPEEPRIFLKPASAVVAHEQSIQLPDVSQLVEHEAELGVVIGQTTTRVAPESAWSRVLGYTCVNDVTARDIQRREGRYTRAKGFDSFCPLGPWVETGVHPQNVRVRCTVNGELRQDGHTANLIRTIPVLIAYISACMTLVPGDIVATGTYGGTGPLVSGDIVTVQIDRVGELSNQVVPAPTTGVFERVPSSA